MTYTGGGPEIDRKLKILLISAISVVTLDQATKYVITSRVPLNGKIEVIPGLFNIVYYMNPGAAFGIFTEGGLAKRVFLIAVSLAALVVIGFLLRDSRDRLTAFALSLIAGGAFGNLIDRVRSGKVIDFLEFYVGEHYWPAFNVADSAITIGVALAIFSYYIRRPERT